MDQQKNNLTSTMKISYDPDGDVLYCSFGDPREGLGVEVGKGMIVRLDPETDDIVGVTVLDFSKRFRDEPDNFLSVPTKKDVLAVLNCQA
jgi:uncharacterized protein YuzE